VPRVGRRSRRLVLLALVAGPFLALAWGPLPGARPAVAQTGAVHEVKMKDFLFMPASVTLKAGDTVKWIYDESATDPMPNCETPVLSTQCPGHTATASTKGSDGKAIFNSGNLKQPGSSYSFTFTNAGTFNYYCVYHGGPTETRTNNPPTNKHGTIVVEAAAAPTPATAGGSAASPSSNVAPGTSTSSPGSISA
jgi:plastocyanin